MKQCILMLMIGLKFNTALCNFFIQDLSIFPTNPTIDDSIRIFYRCYSPASPNWLYNRQLSVSSNEVILETCYREGMKDGTEILFDTVIVGKLAAGTYSLRFYWRWTSSSIDSSCSLSPFNPIDSSFLTFTVTDVMSTRNPLVDNIFFHPNPATTQLTLTTPQPPQPTTATITSINGQVLRQQQLLGSSNTINISELPAGLYFIVVQNAGVRQVRRFVKQ